MGNRIGKPLTEQVGRPRVLPDAIPTFVPEKAPAKKEEKVPVLPDGTEAYVRFRADRARNGTISALARFMKIPESEITGMMDSILFRLNLMYHKVEELGQAQHIRKTPQEPC